ncbi:calponin family repeat-containing domain protein [Cooperia oncophora]
MFNYYSKTSYDEYTIQSSPSPRSLGFPSYYYPTAYEKQPNHALSPRQAEAVERQAPTSAFTQRDPETPALNDTRNGPTHVPTKKNIVPQHYLTFIAAPVGPKSYGNYPEFTGISPKPARALSEEARSQQNRTPSIVLDHYVDENSYDEQPNATMETKVTGQGQPKRVGRWTLAQLRQTDGIIPSQAGWNKGDSQKLMTNFGTPRNTSTRVKAENLQEIPEEIANRTHGEVRLQSGTNKFSSQRGMTGFGTGRDVCREGKHVNTNPADLQDLPEEKIRLSDGIVRLQAGTNKYDSQKGMTGFGTTRRETTKMLDTKHPEYDHERPDQSEIPLQSGTNKFASQKGMTGFGTSRRETTKMIDSSHPEYDHEASIDQTTIPSQMGSNKYASQKGMTGFGQPRWEVPYSLHLTVSDSKVLDPSISWQNRKSQGMVRLQSGTNRFASQQGMTGFGTIRNTTYEGRGRERALRRP